VALAVIAESLDYICAERLTPNLVGTPEHLAAHGELRLSDEVRQLLGQISISGATAPGYVAAGEPSPAPQRATGGPGLDPRYPCPAAAVDRDEAGPL
jgi:hypothetical protein